MKIEEKNIFLLHRPRPFIRYPYSDRPILATFHHAQFSMEELPPQF
jgi:hypothetical protein